MRHAPNLNLPPGGKTMTLLEIAERHAQRTPQAPFATHVRSETTLTYAGLRALVARIRHFLRELRVQEEARIALVGTDHWIFHPLLVSCAAEGLTLVPVNPDLHPDELAFILEDADPAVIVTQEELEPGKRFQHIPQMTIAALVARLDDCPDEVGPNQRGGPGEAVLLVYTSGTTGAGKAVKLTQANLTSMAQTFVDFYDVGPDNRFLCVLPLHHMNGIMITGLLPLAAGAHTYLADVFGFANAKFYWDVVTRYRITIPSLVPSIMAMLCRLFPAGTNAATDVVRFGFCGAAPLPADLWQEFEARFDFPVYQGYGLTETTTWVTATPFAPDHRYDSVGVPLGAEIRIDASGPSPGEHAEGEILARGPQVMPGYFNRRKLTRESFRDGFLKTGDIGYFDKDGELHVTGRKKEIIIRNGVNVNPMSIDEVLRGHEAVAECKTIGMPDPMSGESITTVCVPVDPGFDDANSVMSWIREHMSAFYVPDRVEFMAHLPKGPTGKVKRGDLAGILSGDIATKALAKLTAWKYKSSKPSDPDALLRILNQSYRRATAIPFLMYWGCGKRDSIADVDRATLERLAEYLAAADLVAEAPTSLTIMMNDIHSTINDFSRNHFERYFRQIAQHAEGIGFGVVRQSAVWEKYGLDVETIREEAMSDRFDLEWDRFPLREKLVSQAAKHFQGASSQTGARSYALACSREGPVIADAFDGHIFLTYNGPDMNACLPPMPKLYLYSHRKGKTEKPWFL